MNWGLVIGVVAPLVTLCSGIAGIWLAYVWKDSTLRAHINARRVIVALLVLSALVSAARAFLDDDSKTRQERQQAQLSSKIDSLTKRIQPVLDLALRQHPDVDSGEALQRLRSDFLALIGACERPG